MDIIAFLFGKPSPQNFPNDVARIDQNKAKINLLVEVMEGVGTNIPMLESLENFQNIR